jgi:tetratricopeptide (TPR) repeat protein
MRLIFTIFLLIVPIAGVASAQEKSWVGKTIMVKRIGIKIDGDKQLEIATLEEAAYKVLEDKDDRLKVKTRSGVVGWFDKDDAVRLEDAVAYFTQRIEDNAKDVSALYFRGVAWGMRGDPDKAIKDFSEAIRLNPVAMLFNNRGIAWLKKMNVDKAIADFSKAIDLDPRGMENHALRGGCWVLKKEYDKAIADFDEAIHLQPKNAGLYVSRGVAWREKNNADKAIGDFSQAIQLQPSVGAHRLRAEVWLYTKRDFDKAIADYDAMIKLDPKTLDAFEGRGNAWMGKKEHDKAITDYTEAIRLEPKNGYAYQLRGGAWSAKKDYEKAIADYNEVIRINPKYSRVYLNRGFALSRNKQYEKALADYKEVIRLDPKYSQGYNGVAWLLATAPDEKLRDGKQAVELAKKAIELEPKRAAWFGDTLAAAYAELGNFDEAVRLQERALEDPLLKDDAEAKQRLELYRKKMLYRQQQ